MKSTKIYIADQEEFILAVEGTGDNLLPEDEEEGYKDYIMATIYRVDGYEFEQLDSPQIMLTKLVEDMSQEEFEQAVLYYFGIDKEKATILE